jgi:16S rRNA (cytosine967-C5)-methyltransferase
VSPARLEQLRERLACVRDRVACRFADATALAFNSEFDLVLADVPCSGTGTLSRNPEIRHRLQPDDLPHQVERQRAILLSAVRAIRPGGRLVYSTCSLEPEENEEVVAAVLAENANSRVISLAFVLDALRNRGIVSEGTSGELRSSLTPEGFLRLIPGQFETDGFFIGMIAKSAE